MGMEAHRILIVGAGDLGQALGGVLRAKGNTITFWDIDRAKVAKERPLHEMVPLADIIFLCVPSWAIRSVLSEATSSLRRTTIVAAFSKGIDVSLGDTIGELLPELLPKHQPFIIVGGPMLAAEIAAGKHAAAVFASPDEAIAKSVADIFKSPIFSVEISRDATAVSLAGALKNVYALGLGIVDGLGFDGDAKGWIVARAVQEMMSIAKSLGIEASAMLGTAGLADLIATSYSSYSRNRAIGDEIARKGTCDLKGEGSVSIPPLMARLRSQAEEFPLLGAIKKIVIDCEPAKSIMDIYFAGK